MKIKRKNVTILIILIIIIIITVMTITIIIKTNKDKETPVKENKISLEEFVSEIDMKDTTNSKIREDGMKVNASNKISNGIQYDGVTIEKIKIESTENMAVFNAEIENTSGKDIEEHIVYLKFIDKNGEEIDKIEAVFPKIVNGKTGYISATSPKDIATAYDLIIEKKVQAN